MEETDRERGRWRERDEPARGGRAGEIKERGMVEEEEEEEEAPLNHRYLD